MTGWDFVPADFRQNAIWIAFFGFIAVNVLLWWYIRRDGKVTEGEQKVRCGQPLPLPQLTR